MGLYKAVGFVRRGTVCMSVGREMSIVKVMNGSCPNLMGDSGEPKMRSFHTQKGIGQTAVEKGWDWLR